MYIMITDGTDLTRVGRDEAKRVLELLAAAIAESRRSRRDIERKLGWSRGYLGSVMRGRISLKVWHVFALSRELGIDPLSLFLTVSGPREPGWILQQLGVEPPPPTPEPKSSKADVVRFDREEIEEMMQKLLYGELERFGLLDELGEYVDSIDFVEPS